MKNCGENSMIFFKQKPKGKSQSKDTRKCSLDAIFTYFKNIVIITVLLSTIYNERVGVQLNMK